MVTELAARRVEATPGVALPFGLLSATTLLPVDNVHEQLGVDWMSIACNVAATTGWCPPDPGNPDRVKTFNRPEAQNVTPVTVYAGVECSTVGLSSDEAHDAARAILSIGEQAALESWLWDLIMPTATDASAGVGDESIVGRLAELEAIFGATYGGEGVVHVPLELASYLASSGLAVREGARLRTWTGHRISLGAGYPTTGPGDPVAVPPDGFAWLLITGPVTIRQGTVGNSGSVVNTATNDRQVLAERTDVVQVECNAFAALVEKSCCGVTGAGS